MHTPQKKPLLGLSPEQIWSFSASLFWSVAEYECKKNKIKNKTKHSEGVHAVFCFNERQA